MCIDDYQFRHYSAIRQKQCRRFVITNEDQIERVYLVNISQFQQNGQIALCKILVHLSTKGLPIIDRTFYLAKYDVFLYPNSHCKVPFNALRDKDIRLRSVKKDNMQTLREQHKDLFSNQNYPSAFTQYKDPNYIQIEANCCQACIGKKSHQDLDIRNLLSETGDQQYEEQIEPLQYIPPSPTKQKRNKQPQRNIGEVLFAVKKWRKLYQAKKMKLVQSAKIIGISKKSLDDYFLVLRVGEILGFNFADNLQNKMGDLRSFIRSKGQKVSGKLPKQLKCYDLLPEIDLNNVMQIQSGSVDVQSTEKEECEMKDQKQ